MHKNPIEILAPAGDGAMLRAAVFSGADCVYVGVAGFNARRGAANFGREELAGAVAFCHARGCGVYAALNTVVLPGQEAALDEAVCAVRDAGCDAVIVQDLATARRVAQLAPGLALHGSTQMSVHSLAGVLQLAALGFARVILSRELSEGEIAAIAAQSPVELEVFVHGALCVSVSGQCYASAFLGGRSANRGACAGPCRLPFRAERPQDGNSENLSCARARRPVRAGTARGKGAAGVGGAERPQDGNVVPASDTNHLSLKDLSVLDALPRLAGLGVVSAKIEGRLRGPEYVAVVVDAARRAREGGPYDKQLLRQVFSRSGFTDGWFAARPDADMFGVRTPADTAAVKKAMPAARELYRRERPRVPVAFALSLTQAGGVLQVRDKDGFAAEAAIAGPLAPAANDGGEALRKALGKTGGTPFYASEIALETNGLYLPAAVLNAARRDALDALLAQRSAPRGYSGRAAAIATLAAPGPYAPRKAALPALRARFASVAALPEGAAEYAPELILPLADWEAVAPALRGQVWLEVPRVLFGAAEPAAAAQIAAASRAGFRGFWVNNLAGLQLCHGLPVAGGFGLNLANAAAVDVVAALGCESATLSVELSLAQQRRLCGGIQAKVETDAVVYGHFPLMLTRARPLAMAGDGESGSLVDRQGRRFPVCREGGESTVYNPVPLWMGDRLAALPTHTATLYFTRETPAGALRVLRRFAAGEAAPGEFTRGLYDKGSEGK